MGTIQETLATDLGTIFGSQEITDEVTYTPSGGEPVTIQALLAPERDDYRNDEQAEYLVRNRECTILTDADTGVAAPAREDTVTIGSTVWAVEQVIEIGPGWAQLLLVSRGRKRLAGNDAIMDLP